MSNISNRHSIQHFTAGESKPLTGQRLAKIGYKKSKDNPNPAKSICVSVPQIVVDQISAEQIQSLMPHLISVLENAQDGIVRSLYESRDCDIAKFSSVSDEEISVNACIAFLNAESSGGRLTKEWIEHWFVQNVEDNLTVVIAEKLGFTEITEDNQVVIDKHLNAYRELMKSLGGNKISLNKAQISGLRRAIEISSVEDETAKKLTAKLNDVEKSAEELLLNL